MGKRYQYSITIATASNLTQDESHRCLRAFLKVMLRQWDIKCVSAVALTPLDDAQNAPQSTNEATNDN